MKKIRKHYHLEKNEYFLMLGDRKSQKVKVLATSISTGNCLIWNYKTEKREKVNRSQLTFTPFY